MDLLVQARSAIAYAAGLTLDDPQVSPLYVNFTKGFPPTLVQEGPKVLLPPTGANETECIA